MDTPRTTDQTTDQTTAQTTGAATDRALSSALSSTTEGLSIGQLADLVGVPAAVVEAAAREGLLGPDAGTADCYPPEAENRLRAGAELLNAGLPLGELLDLARRFDAAVVPVAEHVVEVFARFVKDAASGMANSDEDAAARVTEAFSRMLPAAQQVVQERFGDLVIGAAQRRLAEQFPGPE